MMGYCWSDYIQTEAYGKEIICMLKVCYPLCNFLDLRYSSGTEIRKQLKIISLYYTGNNSADPSIRWQTFGQRWRWRQVHYT